MIKAAELRVGNLIRYTGKPYPYYPIKDGIVEVEEVLQDGVNLSEGGSTLYESENLEGIPLTPKWLERCGFVDKVSYWEYNGVPGFVLLKDNEGGLYIGNPVRTYVKTVHHLQSLYFALTEGKELTIKEQA